MNHPHLPRSLIILVFFLVAATFLVGTLNTFAPAHAAIVLEDQAQKADLPSVVTITPTSTSIADFPPLLPTLIPPPTSLLPPPIDNATSISTPPPTLTPMPIPISNPGYADTTGIIALAILMVVVMLVGMVWGGSTSRMNNEPKI